MTARWIRPLFIAAALYDGILGVAVVLFALPLFRLFGVEPPNHVGYVQFPALLLLIFAAMFAQIASDPAAHRRLIPYGIALKIAYSGSVFWHQAAGGVPFMWVPWAWIDLIFVGLFLAASRQLAQPSRL